MTGSRPTPPQWLAYVFTGRLPARCREWVLHDTTCSTWVLRHCVRFLIQLSPLILVVLLALPTSIWIRLGCVFAGVAASVVFSFGYTVEGAERRVEKAGYPFGTAGREREARATAAQRASAARRREKIAARRARRAS